MQVLSQLRWLLFVAPLIVGIFLVGPFVGLKFGFWVGDQMLIALPAFCLISLALGTWGARALRPKGTWLGWSLTAAVFSVMAWTISWLGGMVAEDGPAALVPLVVLFIGAAVGTFFNALALIGLVIEARNARV